MAGITSKREQITTVATPVADGVSPLETMVSKPTAARSGQIRYLFVQVPRCPDCNSSDLLTQRTETDADGVKTRHCKCDNCGGLVRLVLE